MKELLLKAKGLAAKAGKLAKDIAPEAALVIGVVGVVVGVVVACTETHDGIDEIIDDAAEKKEIIKKTAEAAEENGEEYTSVQKGKDTLLVYTQMGKRMFKLYFPAVLIETCSVTLILAGFHILKKRNAALTVAYTSLAGAYDSYRKRVRDAIGEEAEYKLANDIKEEYVETIETDAKGKEKKVKVLQKTCGDLSANPYARIFDEYTTSMWRNDPVINMATLEGTQSYLNDLFDIQGYLLLNDAFDALGLERTDIGCVAGWVKGKGDRYVSIGLGNKEAKDFMMCKAGRNGVLLNFNCCGYILDDIRMILSAKKEAEAILEG